MVDLRGLWFSCPGLLDVTFYLAQALNTKFVFGKFISREKVNFGKLFHALRSKKVNNSKR